LSGDNADANANDMGTDPAAESCGLGMLLMKDPLDGIDLKALNKAINRGLYRSIFQFACGLITLALQLIGVAAIVAWAMGKCF
jgi:hypothetical protein